MKRLAVIPARGGSKRIKNKNIREFCGRPMIAHVLAAARESGLFDVIHVSTESAEIRDVVARAGFAPQFLRPESLADDHTPIMPVLRHVVETYAGMGQSFDQVWMLMACAPLIESSDLKSAAAIFDSAKAGKPMIAVCEYPAPVEWAFEMDPADHSLRPREAGMFAVRSQDLGKKYFDAGAFAVFPSNDILQSSGAGSDTNFMGYPLSRAKAIDIDTEDDWHFAEALYQARSPRAQ